jgi:hypothetical protein
VHFTKIQFLAECRDPHEVKENFVKVTTAAVYQHVESMTKTSSQWDISRFIKTLSFFGSIPIVSQVNTMFFGSSTPPPPQPALNSLMNFAETQNYTTQIWGPLDDVVMGGVSQSQAQATSEGLLFTGLVSTQNSGGFASIRTKNFATPLNLKGYEGVSLTVKGDGQRYKFFVRDSTSWDSIAYAISFDTAEGEWITVKLPFQEMQPVQRAKTLSSAPDLNLEGIASLQLMLSKFEYNGALNPSFKAGEFRLLLGSIGLF